MTDKEICVMAYAEDAKGALEATHKVAEEKLGYFDQGGAFDYYIDATSGEDQLGPIPTVLQVSTTRFPVEDRRGLELVNCAMNKNRKTFMRSMAFIREFIARFADDELFDKETLRSATVEGEYTLINSWEFPDYCEDALGVDPALGVYLFDYMGHPVFHPLKLWRILHDSDENPLTLFMDPRDRQDPDWKPGTHLQPLWVVPFYVGFE